MSDDTRMRTSAGDEAGRFLVTGGAGFIGSHLASALLRAGHHVTILDDLSSGRRENLEEVAESANGRSLRFVEGSIVDDDVLDDAIDGASAIFHQAAIPSVPRSFADPAATLRVNVEGTARVLEACRRHGVPRLVFASSSSVYGDTPSLPKTEDMTPTPLSPYALSKLAGEQLCEIHSQTHGIETVCLRYFNVFGPRQDPNSEYAAVVPGFISRMLSGRSPTIYGTGEQSRDFTYIDNVVAANFLAAGLDAGGLAGGAAIPAAGRTGRDGALVVNVGAGDRHTIIDLVSALNSVLGTELGPDLADPRPGDVMHSHASVERAARCLGYQPEVGFEEGLRRTATWFRERAAVSGPDHSHARA